MCAEYEALRGAWQARLAEIGEADSGDVVNPVAGDAGEESGPGDARGDESQLSPEDELLVDIVRRVSCCCCCFFAVTWVKNGGKGWGCERKAWANCCCKRSNSGTFRATCLFLPSDFAVRRPQTE